MCVCIYYCSTYYKAVRVGEGDSGGHVLRESTRRRQAEACVHGQTSPIHCGVEVTKLSTNKHHSLSHSQALLPIRCVCLLLQDLLYSCVRGGEGDSEGHVL